MLAVPQTILLEMLAHVPMDLLHCSHCERLFGVAGIGTPVHQEIRAAYPAEMLGGCLAVGTADIPRNVF